MDTPLLLLGAVPLIALLVFLGTRQGRREAQAMRAFAALLEGGTFTPGNAGRGPRATGRWKGVDVEVAFFGRLEPPVFLTAVRASRRPSPVAALLVPRGAPRAERERPPDGTPVWLERLDRAYDAGCAPAEAFRVIVDAETADGLTALADTEVEILPGHVSVQRREVLVDAPALVPYLDAAARLVGRLDAVRAELVGPSDADANRRTREVTAFLDAFRR